MAAFRIDHVDTRVRSLAAVEPFYDLLMPALGWAEKSRAYIDPSGDWHEPSAEHPYNAIEFFAPSSVDNPPPFIGFIEDPGMQPTGTRIAFALESAAEVSAWRTKLHEMGALNVDPSNDMDDYPAIFFEDPVGTRLEVCARRKRTTI